MNYSANEPVFDDKALEAIFKQAVIDDFDRMVAEVFTADIPKITPSERHARRMKALLARERRRPRVTAINRLLRRCAAVAAILIVVLNAALLTVPTVRAEVGGVFIEWFDNYIQFRGDGVNPTNPELMWEPTYIPDGYTEMSRAGNLIKSIDYANAESEALDFTYVTSENSLSVYTADTEYGQVVKGGIVYHTFTAINESSVSSVTWDMGAYRFLLEANMSIEELLKIAESVRKLS